MAMSSSKLLKFFIFYLSTTLSILKSFIYSLLTLNRPSIIFTVIDTLFSTYFQLCGLTPFTVDLDDQTTLHFWISRHRKFNKPNLVMIHGYGGDARWQFLYQVSSLAKEFNLYMPDLLFFGHSYSHRPDRTDVFQAKCLAQGLKLLGVDRYSVYSISYGGYVAYQMAQICSKEMERLVVVSSGIGWSDDNQKEEKIKQIGRDPKELLVPTNPRDLRLLVKLAVYKSKPLRWLPDFLLQEFINAMGNSYRKEKLELLGHLMAQRAGAAIELPTLSQETLLIWGDQDVVFPVGLAYQLQRHLGSKSRLEIIKDTGHAVNIESPAALNSLIATFVHGQSS